ncbi:MAG: tetratricopeptide repeat protein, partial [Holophagales bacterium]|nr:tetratricopeptide repeat protein [Holophagales bacterium]
MSNEATKIKEQFGQLERRVLRGKGIDIGCGNAPIFPNVRCFDQQDGDANRISDYVKEQFDFVFSSHCLEHMLDPRAALKDWWSLVKEGGYLYVVVPDEDLYEQGVWPSKFNYEHKCTFTIFKEKSWSPVSVNVMDLIRELSDCYPVRIALQDNYYNYTLKGVDQTLGRALAQIQFVLRKGDPNERGASENDTGAGQRDPQLIKFFTEAMSRHTRGEWSAALLSYKRIQRQFPYFADAWTNGSMALFNLDRLDEALTAATTALVLAPESPSAHCALANALQGLGRTDEAAEHFEKAILLDPDHIPALTNLAVIHVHKGNFKEALDLENEALNINPYHSALWGNRGYTKMRMLDLGSAEDDLRVALELADNNQARWNLAYLQMIEGRYREAWPNFRASLYLDEWSANARDFGKPRWNGEDLNGGTLLVCTDSRFGDTLQFSRFLPRLKRFGGRVLLWTYQPLKRLLSDLSGIDGLVVEGEPLSDFDFVVPIMELPIILDADTADLTPLPPPLLTPTPPIPEL